MNTLFYITDGSTKRLPLGVPQVRSSMPLLAIKPVGFEDAIVEEYGREKAFPVPETSLRKVLCIAKAEIT